MRVFSKQFQPPGAYLQHRFVRRSRFGEFLNRLKVRQRLLVLVGVFAIGWIVTLGVATSGLLSGRSDGRPRQRRL